jgi:hypothetical protein
MYSSHALAAASYAFRSSVMAVETSPQPCNESCIAIRSPISLVGRYQLWEDNHQRKTHY